MTQEEFNNLPKEEFYALPNEVVIKHYIKFTEERYISYKKLLEEVYKDKETFPPGDEFVIWFKEHLREMKNSEESSLKKLHLELKYGGELPFWLKEKPKKITCPTCEGKGVVSENEVTLK